MIKVERRHLCGRYVDHSPSEWYGPFKLTWVRAPWGWMLAFLDRVETEPDPAML